MLGADTRCEQTEEQRSEDQTARNRGATTCGECSKLCHVSSATKSIDYLIQLWGILGPQPLLRCSSHRAPSTAMSINGDTQGRYCRDSDTISIQQATPVPVPSTRAVRPSGGQKRLAIDYTNCL